MSKQDRTGGSVPPPQEPTRPDGGLIPSKQMSTLPKPGADAAWGPVNALSPEEAAAKRKRLQERWDAEQRTPQPEAEPKHDPKVKLERKKQPETFEFGQNAAKAESCESPSRLRHRSDPQTEEASRKRQANRWR